LNLPKPTSLEWLRALIDMTIHARGNDFAIRRIERDARALLERDDERPELCWLVLAFVAFLRGDRDECVRAVDAAHALARNDIVVLSNAASLLINLGLPRMAAAYARRLAALSNGDARQALNAVNVLYAALHLEEAADWLRNIERYPRAGAGALMAQLDGLSASFRASGVSVEMRVALMETAVAAIGSAGYAVRYIAPDYFPDDTLRYELYVDQSIDQCAKLGFSIARSLTEKFDRAYPELITFVCSPLALYIPAGNLIELAA
jgi:tetratricopeptide (TPR) repeat protein